MDSLKTLVANVADLLDRQLALLVDVRYNHGLPSNLSGARPTAPCSTTASRPCRSAPAPGPPKR
jgi:histidine ammonia-lyase